MTMERAALEASIDYMTDVATGQHAHDHPVGRHYHAVVAAARAHLETLPKPPRIIEMWHFECYDTEDDRLRVAVLETQRRAEVAMRAATNANIICKRVTGPHKHLVPI